MSRFRESLVILVMFTQFFRNPVEAKGKLLDLYNQVVRERGEACCSGKTNKLMLILSFFLKSFFLLLFPCVSGTW